LLPLLIVLLALGRAPSAMANDWPQWLGPERNGVSAETIAPWTSAPKVVWRHPVGNGYSTPIVAAGKFFVHAQAADKDAEEVLALDAQTGDVAWRDTYERSTYKSALGAGPRATPTYHEGRLLTYGITGVLTCYDAAGGKRLWQVRPIDDLKATLPAFGACASPLAVDGKVIVPVGGPGSSIVAYDVATGNIAWKGLDEPAGSASPILLRREAGQGVDVVVQTTLRIAGLDPNDGTVRWEHPLVFQPSGVSPTPLVSGDCMVCTTQDTGTLALRFSAAKESANPASPWWHRDWSSYFSTGATGRDGKVFVVTNLVMPLPRADVRCVNAATGEELWQKQSLGYFHVGLITCADGKLLLLDDAGNLTLADTADGFKQLARAKVCRGTFVNPVLADGKLYTRDDKEVQCLDLTK